MNYLHGLTATRLLRALAVSRGDPLAAEGFAKSAGWSDRDAVIAHLRSGVGGLEDATALDGRGDARLDLLAALRPLTLTGRLPLRRIPRQTPMLTQEAGTVAHWIGQGAARKMSAGTYSRSSLATKNVAALTVASNQLLANPSWEGEETILGDLLAACVQALDMGFADPANTGDANTPASITSDATPIVATSSDIAGVDEALRDAISALTLSGSDLRAGYWLMSPITAAGLATLRGSSGAPGFPLISAIGGSLLGLPVLTSGAIGAAEEGHYIALVDASQIAYVEDAPALRTSQHAMIEMDTAPTGDTQGPTSASVHLASMFQEEATALMATLRTNWAPRRDGMAQLITELDFATPSV